jgi:hypothetical protein
VAAAQLLTESVVLALTGAVVGLAFAHFGTRALVALIAMPGVSGAVSLDLALNLRLLAFTILVATFTVVLCGLFPAWRATRVSAQGAMKAQARGVIEGHTRFRLGKALVVAQVAPSFSSCRLILIGVPQPRDSIQDLYEGALLATGPAPHEHRAGGIVAAAGLIVSVDCRASSARELTSPVEQLVE